MSDTALKPILLVEDNPDDVELTRIGLDTHHLANRLVVARDGEEALNLLFGGHAPEYAFVLLDLKLPKVDGFTVLDRIRTDPRTQMLPVIILTSSGEQEDVLSGYRTGANSYIRKPVDFEEFTRAVSTVGLYWGVINKVPATGA